MMPLAYRLGISQVKFVAAIGDLDYVIYFAGISPLSLPTTRNAEKMIAPKRAPPCRSPRICDVPVL